MRVGKQADTSYPQPPPLAGDNGKMSRTARPVAPRYRVPGIGHLNAKAVIRTSGRDIAADEVFETVAKRWDELCRATKGDACQGWTVQSVMEHFAKHDGSRSKSLNNSANLLGVEPATLGNFLAARDWLAVEAPAPVVTEAVEPEAVAEVKLTTAEQLPRIATSARLQQLGANDFLANPIPDGSIFAALRHTEPSFNEPPSQRIEASLRVLKTVLERRGALMTQAERRGQLPQIEADALRAIERGIGEQFAEADAAGQRRLYSQSVAALAELTQWYSEMGE